MPTPPRRWFAFRLRTLFVVVAVLAILLGSWIEFLLNWIRERRFALQHSVIPQIYEGKPGQNYAPAGLWIFGDYGVISLQVRETKPGEIERIQRLFPEAEVGE